MATRRSTLSTVVPLIFAVACGEPPADPTGIAPSFHREGADGRSHDAFGPYGVGHSTFQIVHTGSAGERRPIDVHLWYPARRAGYEAGPRTVYTSRLFGLPLVPGTYDPLSFSFPAVLAREGVAIEPHGPQFPLLVWSHGAGNDALDYAFTEEGIASHGFVVAGIQHTGNSQDDGLVDFINQLVGTPVLGCLDALPPPCSGGALGTSVKDRVADVSALLDEMEDVNGSRFAGRIDLGRVGVIGHSRGTMTAIAAVAGNSASGIAVEPRIRAIMTLSSGNLAFSAAEMAQVTLPALMMAGAVDKNQPVPMVRSFFDQLTNASRLFVVVRDAEHRTFDSALCPRMQAAGALRLQNPRAILEDRTVNTLLISPLNGSTLDYCSFDHFVEPVDIRPLVSAMSGVDVTEANVPRELDADEMSRLSVHLAIPFFQAALDEHGCDRLRFKRVLNPKYLMRHEPNILSAEAIVPGQDHHGDDDDDDNACGDDDDDDD